MGHARTLARPTGRATTPLRLPRFTLDHVWLTLPPGLALLASSFQPVEAVDLWWSLLIGGRVPIADPIVFTPVTQVANVQWLAQWAIATVHAWGGLGLLLTLRSALVGATVALAELLALRVGATAIQAGRAAALVAPLMVAGAALRPQLFALPLFVVLLLLGGPLAGRRGVRAGVALVVAIWANVHGSYVLAPVALGLLAVGSVLATTISPTRSPGVLPALRSPWPMVARERFALAAVASLAPLASPAGLASYSAVLQVSLANGGGGVLGLAQEWQPLSLLSPYGTLCLFLLGAVVVGGWRFGVPDRWAWLTLTLPFALLAIGGARHSSWLAMTALPLAAFGLGKPAVVARHPSLFGSGLVAALMLAGMLALARPLAVQSGATNPASLLAADVPVALADRLAELAPRRTFAFSDWGGYLAWRLRPDGRLYVDNRFEQHPPEVWAAYRQISLAEPGWETLLEAAGVQALALERDRQGALVEAAQASSSWRLEYVDARGAIFVRVAE